MNRSELYQTCRQAGLVVHPGTPREYLIAYLHGDYDPPPLDEAAHPVDRWRHGIINFLREYWTKMLPQLTGNCPAKNLYNTDPAKQVDRPCFKCLDQQVFCCVSDPKYESFIGTKFLPGRQQ